MPISRTSSRKLRGAVSHAIAVMVGLLVLVGFPTKRLEAVPQNSFPLLPLNQPAESSPQHAGDIECSFRLQLLLDRPLWVEGGVEAKSGHFRHPRNLSMDAATTSAFRLTPAAITPTEEASLAVSTNAIGSAVHDADGISAGARLEIRPAHAVDRIGVDVDFRGPLSEILQVKLTLRSSNKPNPSESLSKATPALQGAADATFEVDLSIPVADLLDGVVDQTVANGIRLWVGRPGGDAMRIDLANGRPMIFDAEESVPLSVDLLAVPELTGKPASNIATERSSKASTKPLAKAAIRPMELRMELRRDDDEELVWQKSLPIDAALADDLFAGRRVRVHTDQMTVPESEGVYSLRCRIVPAGSWRFVERLARTDLLTRPDLLRPDRLLAEEVIAERSCQFVVLQPLPPVVEDSSPWREHVRWTPNQRSWFGIDLHSLESSERIELAEHLGKTVAVLPPSSHFSQPLQAASDGRPHVLVVRYARDQPVKMAVCVRQKDESGAWSTLGVDTAVVDEWSLDQGIRDIGGNGYGESQANASDPNFAEHRLLFWPRNGDALLIVKNENSRAPLKIESLSIDVGPTRLTSEGLGTPQDRMDGRMAAIFLDKPLLVDAFGCDRRTDENGSVALDDWTTFLQGGRRLVDYVRASGANTAVLSVISEGGSLYPSARFLATPRFDTGVFFADGRDPHRKDVLELLLRLFDRSGLHLVTNVELGMPLARLEQLAESPETAEGIRWIDHLRRSYLEKYPPRRGIGVYYNILDPRVGDEFTGITDEIVQRYSHHRSFSGIGLGVGAGSMVQLPPPAYGRDGRTFERLRTAWITTQAEQAKQVRGNPDASSRPSPEVVTMPSGPSLDHWLDGEGNTFFVAWRANQLTALLHRIATKLDGKPLVLVTSDYRQANAEIPGGDALQFGLDWRALGADPLVLPLRLIRRRLLVEPARRIEDAKINEDFAWDDMLAITGNPSVQRGTAPAGSSRFEGWTSGGLLFYPPEPESLVLPTSQVNSGRLTIFPQSLPHTAEHRRDLARFLDNLDSQMLLTGGWTPTQNPDPSIADFMATFAQLPRGNFDRVEATDSMSSVVRVRHLKRPAGTVAYAVNLAPWPMRLRLASDAAAGTPVRRLGPNAEAWAVGTTVGESDVVFGNDLSGKRAGNEATGMVANAKPDGISTVWVGTLQPGELIALEIEGPSSGIARWSAAPLADPLPELVSRVDDLAARVAILGRPRHCNGLENGGFEGSEGDADDKKDPTTDNAPDSSVFIDGWMRSQYPEDCVSIDRRSVEGQQALVLRTNDAPGARTWLLSAPFDSPETGRLAVSMRARAISGQPTLRLAVEGRFRGAALRYSVNIQPKQASKVERQGAIDAQADPSAWPETTYWLYVPNLPEGKIEDLRIAIDLTTAGAVAVDDVQLFDFFFTQREREGLQRQTFVAAERLRHGDPSVAVRLLDSHWARYLRWLDMPAEDSTGGEPGPDVGVVAPRSANWKETNAPVIAPVNNSPAPTIADRIRQYLPAPLRF